MSADAAAAAAGAGYPTYSSIRLYYIFMHILFEYSRRSQSAQCEKDESRSHRLYRGHHTTQESEA